MRIAFAADILIREAATMKDVVSNGAGARSARVPSFTLVTVRGSFVPFSAAYASSLVQNFSWVCRASKA